MSKAKEYYIGWDVGGWNCCKNSKSKDAVVILDSSGFITEKQWRGNLKETINTSEQAIDLIKALLNLCNLKEDEGNVIVTMAIDAPLGFPNAFRELLERNIIQQNIEQHSENSYLFRQTEKSLFNKGFSPLSAIKDMIGSQTTKAMHLVAKFAPVIQGCGIWTNKSKQLTIIETYPSACRNIQSTNKLLFDEMQDIKDALVCAEIAYLFLNDKKKLNAPDKNIPEKEGWIWALK